MGATAHPAARPALKVVCRCDGTEAQSKGQGPTGLAHQSPKRMGNATHVENHRLSVSENGIKCWHIIITIPIYTPWCRNIHQHLP